MEPGKHFVITLIKGEDELPRDYVSRCNDIAAFARERSSTETTTAVINLDHTTQVSEIAYEIVTPGYTSPEEQASERDTHFANWAASVWDELHTLSTCKIDEADKERYEVMDKEILARAGYDLVSHARNILAPGEFVEMVSDFEVLPEQEKVHTEEE